MPHKDLRAGLYGIVAGIILGAGALGSAQQFALQGSVLSTNDIRLQNASSPSTYTRRSIDLQGIPLRNITDKNSYPTVKTSSSSSSISPVMTTSADCDVATRTALKIQSVYNLVIPVTLKNTDIRRQMDAAFAGAMNDYCAQTASSSSLSSDASSSAVSGMNNHCENYAKTPIRHTQCVLAEQHGKKYP